MSASERQVRWLRILGVLAIVHSALLVWGVTLPFGAGGTFAEYGIRIWVAFATLWFFWPLVLALHPAQSARRTLVPLAFCAPLFFAWFLRPYAQIFGPEAFELPDFVHLNPVSMADYSLGYGKGWIGGREAARQGHFILEGYGFGFFAPGAPSLFSEGEIKKCGIERRAIAACSPTVCEVGHARGWNRATMAALEKRFPEVVGAAWYRDFRYEQSYYEGLDEGKAAAVNDLSTGTFAIEEFHTPLNPPDELERMLFEKYQLKLKWEIPGTRELMNHAAGHRTGYNSVVEEEIARRFGQNALHEIQGARANLNLPKRN